jgi:hypothetical protein
VRKRACKNWKICVVLIPGIDYFESQTNMNFKIMFSKKYISTFLLLTLYLTSRQNLWFANIVKNTLLIITETYSILFPKNASYKRKHRYQNCTSKERKQNSLNHIHISSPCMSILFKHIQIIMFNYLTCMYVKTLFLRTCPVSYYFKMDSKCCFGFSWTLEKINTTINKY